ncbi:hypothetical protein QTP88_026974 [Uroleucon formosanum]
MGIGHAIPSKDMGKETYKIRLMKDSKPVVKNKIYLGNSAELVWEYQQGNSCSKKPTPAKDSRDYRMSKKGTKTRRKIKDENDVVVEDDHKSSREPQVEIPETRF